MTGLPGIVGIDPVELVELIETLTERRLTVATAESLTAGLMTALLTEVPGASAVVRGGIVCYATDLKASAVGVEAALLDRVGPVHPEVARQLADGAARVCGAAIGVGLTGVAGPDPQGGHEPGTVFVALSRGGATQVRELLMPGASRVDIRYAAVRCAVDMVRDSVALVGREQ